MAIVFFGLLPTGAAAEPSASPSLGVFPARGPVTVLDSAVDSQGRVLVLGQNGEGGFLVRFGADGEPDSSFGVAGAVSLGPATTIAVQSDDKILVGSSLVRESRRRPDSDLLIRRILVDGEPDPSFGEDGNVRIDGAFEETAERIFAQPDGHIVLVATVGCPRWYCGYTATTPEVLRFGPEGRLIHTLEVHGHDEAFTFSSAVMSASGAVTLLGGWRQIGVGIVLRVRPDGRWDRRFSGRKQIRTIQIRFGEESQILPNRKFVQLERLSPELSGFGERGAPDRSFGNNGVAGCQDSGHGFVEAASDTGDRILALADGGPCGLVKFTSAGQPDPMFGADGVADIYGAGLPRPGSLAVRDGYGVALTGWDESVGGVWLAHLDGQGRLVG
jgi:uncharacterized delta-60 repeat protein